MNFFDFLAWPLAFFTRPLFIMIALVLAAFAVWGWLFSHLRYWIEAPYRYWSTPRDRFRNRIALPVTLLVCIGLTYLIITTAIFVVALSPDGFVWA